MISSELARKIRILQITTRKVVNDVLAGEYTSVFKGRGMELDRPYVKRFVEERELTVFFLVDLSASGAFGSVKKLKNEIAAEFCALLSFSAVKNNDKVGLIVFTDRVELYVPPKKGTTHVLRLIRELLNFRPKAVKTDIGGTLDYFGKVAKKRAVVFLVSDFQSEGFEKAMRIISKRHDLIAVPVTDPREVRLPNVGLIELEDAETGEMVLIDTSSAAVRKKYERLGRERSERFRELFASMGVDQIEVMTDRDYVSRLVQFFRARERRY